MKHFIIITSTALLFLGCTHTQPQIVPDHTAQNQESVKVKEVSKRPKPSLGAILHEAKKRPSASTQVFEEEIVENQREEIENSIDNTALEVIVNEPISDPSENSKVISQERQNVYGNAPTDYRTAIRNYFSKKVDPNATIKYIFSRPTKAEKNNKSWKGWMVEVDLLKRNGKGQVLRSDSHLVLFKGNEIVEELSSSDRKKITKVIY